MANFLLTYYGGAVPQTKEDQDRVMRAWTDWFAKLGDRLIDGGNPVSQVRTVAPDRSVSDGVANPPTGYSIISSDSIDGAVDLVKGCPVLDDGATVQVAETFGVM